MYNAQDGEYFSYYDEIDRFKLFYLEAEDGRYSLLQGCYDTIEGDNAKPKDKIKKE